MSSEENDISNIKHSGIEGSAFAGHSLYLEKKNSQLRDDLIQQPFSLQAEEQPGL